MTPYVEGVRAVVARIPRGRVMTYVDVAAATGRGSARSVGGVLSRYGQGLPCHRVVRSDGQVKRVDTERNAGLLQAEGVALVAGRVDLAALRWLPAPVPASDLGRRGVEGHRDMGQPVG